MTESTLQRAVSWMVPGALLLVLLVLVAVKFKPAPGEEPQQQIRSPKAAPRSHPPNLDRPFKIHRPPREPWIHDEHTQDLIDAGILSGAREPRHWALLGRDHQLTKQAVNALGLDLKTRAAVQECFDRFYDKHAREFRMRTSLVKHLSNPENGIHVFDIPAVPDRGVEARTQLRSRLESLAGLDAAARMMRALPSSALSYCGRLDVRIQLYPNSSPEAPAHMKQFASWERIDPRTGRPSTSFRNSSSERLQRDFGIDFAFLHSLVR